MRRARPITVNAAASAWLRRTAIASMTTIAVAAIASRGRSAIKSVAWSLVTCALERRFPAHAAPG